MCSRDVEPKRKTLELISNIFRKKGRETASVEYKDVCDSGSKKNRIKLNSNSLPNVYLTATTSATISCDYKFAPKSPISVRVSNINADMEALTLSRNDNPYIQQTLERISASSIFGDSNLTLSLSPTDSTKISQSSLTRKSKLFQSRNMNNSNNHERKKVSISSIDIDENLLDDDNLHSHLIRSPPPQFPQRFSQFVFRSSIIQSPNIIEKNFPPWRTNDDDHHHLHGENDVIVDDDDDDDNGNDLQMSFDVNDENNPTMINFNSHHIDDSCENKMNAFIRCSLQCKQQQQQQQQPMRTGANGSDRLPSTATSTAIQGNEWQVMAENELLTPFGSQEALIAAKAVR